MIKNILFINPWNFGGMKHYSESVINIIRGNKNYNLTYQNKFKINSLFNMRPSVVHINSGHPFLIPLYPLFLFYNSVITVHDAKPHEGESTLKKIYHKIHLWFIYLFIKKIIVHSEKIKDELPSYFKNKKVYVMPHVNYNLLAKDVIKISKKNSKLNILFFGRILDYKGLDYLISAFEKLPPLQYQLIIAGEGNLPINFKEGENIKVYNEHVSDKKMKELFSKSDVVVCPYVSASQSGVVYMAFAFNKPVIATNVGGIPEVVKNNFNGLLITPKSSDKIIKSIKQMNNKRFYNRLVNNIKGQKESEDKEILKKLEKIYDD